MLHFTNKLDIKNNKSTLHSIYLSEIQWWGDIILSYILEINFYSKLNLSI